MKNPPTILDLKESLRPQMEEVDWIVKAPASHLTALHVRDGLGSLPRRLNKTYVQFDFDETRTYGGLPGSKLAGFAAKIVLTARDETRLLKTIRGMVMGLLGPLVAYLRVNLAMTRLEEAMTQCGHSGLDPEGREIDDKLSNSSRPSGSTAAPSPGMTEFETPPACHPALDAGPREGVTHAEIDGALSLVVPDKPTVFRDDDVERPPPAFRWRESPASIYNFKEQTEKLGYDPRETSAFWIERRANALRTRWTAYGKHRQLRLNPAQFDFLPNAKRRGDMPETNFTPDIPVRDFIPVAADYGVIWPPFELPDGPPKLKHRVKLQTATPKTAHEDSDDVAPCVSLDADFSPVSLTRLNRETSTAVLCETVDGAVLQVRGISAQAGHACPQKLSRHDEQYVNATRKMEIRKSVTSKTMLRRSEGYAVAADQDVFFKQPFMNRKARRAAKRQTLKLRAPPVGQHPWLDQSSHQ